MAGNPKIEQGLEEVRKALVQTGYVDEGEAGVPAVRGHFGVAAISKIEKAVRIAREAQEELKRLSGFLHERVVDKVLELEPLMRDPDDVRRLRSMLEAIPSVSDELRREPGFVSIYGELLSIYILILFKSGSAGRESPIIRMILRNTARRKSVNMSTEQLDRSLARVADKVTVAMIAKRRAVFVLATRGLKILFREEIDFHTYGPSPDNLALQIVNRLVKHGVKLSEVTDLVCAGGDVGALPDGIYALDEQLRAESARRLAKSSLNRGALVTCELRRILREQSNGSGAHVSLTSPLSFSTLAGQDLGPFATAESLELQRSLHGYVKVTPLKSIAAIMSEIQGISQENLNLLVMPLDELFASVVRKTGTHITRELAAQDANSVLSTFDFPKIVECLDREKFQIPPGFRLGTADIGTGVKEICELLMIIESGKLSDWLTHGLTHVVDTYAKRVAMILEMASAGPPKDRPHFVVITSMMALDPYFQRLFAKIRNRIDNPFTPVMCLDSLEHEYLIANHLFELYVREGARDRRLVYSVESRSMTQALRMLRSSAVETEAFSFAKLQEQVATAISDGRVPPGDLVLVGADNEDALAAAAHAKAAGLIRKLTLIGDEDSVGQAADRAKLAISPGRDDDVEIVPPAPLAVDYESRSKSIAEVFGSFLEANPHYVVMKGSLSTAPLLRQALSIYKADEDGRRMASHTALFVLPDGRWFALSDAAVNPGFRSPKDLLTVIENQLEIVRKVSGPEKTLKVAIITAVEKETKAIPATHLAGETVDMADSLEEKYGPLVVEGPLSFDLATVPEAAEEKHYEGRIRGDANCLIATDINTANVLYKMLSKTMGSLGLVVDSGGVITAGPGSAPIILTSRGDTAQTKFNSIVLALAYRLFHVKSSD